MLTIPGITNAVAVPLGQEVTYDECLALAADGHPVAAPVVGDSARALGRLAALVANVSMATTVVLAGEGIELARVARLDLDQGLAEGRDPRANPVTIEILDIDFAQFARGAAVSAIQDWACPQERR
jgi:predicted NBD/HSP70 family sugar kinase